ncbi:RNI-like protein [Sodiomyces alkalinus F11]|uniref:RNI-like protein n=1 Tax=Sodiomyces alkalinus (strain CBS 110278 / VKM F-3762 / F11) TaxID=1314773 RepID=A0A3N2Q946_SODAK|nr:RNI-like protein [Sodiomyces alkalinus F11]ROT43217.1 RNI-like protein [Sodiomyces alkalinus F11]
MSRRVTGPRSALTDYLAANNISATRIRQEAEQRRGAAATERGEPPVQNDVAEESSVAEEAAAAAVTVTEAGPSTRLRTRSARSGHTETNADQEKKKKTQKQVIEKIKAQKAAKRRKKNDGDDGDDFDLDFLDSGKAALPGQRDNCEDCGQRFTVTPYSRTGPNGGLLCMSCSRDLNKKDSQGKKRKKRISTGPVGKRRQVQSTIMDGSFQLGAPSLVSLCVNTLAKNAHLADSLEHMPERSIDAIAQHFSRHRLVNPNTLPLFLQPGATTIRVYDCAYLGSHDLTKILQICPKLKHLTLRNAIQFKDEVMDFLLSRHIELETFSLHGANLLSEDRWERFLATKGEHLVKLSVWFTDRHFGDNIVSRLHSWCPKLERLKIDGNQELTSEGVKAIGKIQSLRQLYLRITQNITPKALVSLIGAIGAKLEVLVLADVPECNDEVLTAIKKHCTALRKLRIMESEHITDEGFTDLFTNWGNSPLKNISFAACRHLDAVVPRENPDKVGLCSDGFRALMDHSGQKLKQLDIASCRHVGKAALEEVFSETKKYPDLLSIDVSFCEDVDDFIVGRIFRSCPALKELKVFGCMRIGRDVQPPRNVVLLGVPNAMGVEIGGTW